MKDKIPMAEILGKGKLNSHGQEPLEPLAEAETEEDGQGRWAKFQQFGLKIIWPGNGKAKRAVTILYGSICSELVIDQEQDETGTISFEYETRAGFHRCTIRGTGLDRLHDHLSEGKRMTLRVRDGIDGVLIEKIEEEKAGKSGR